MCRCITVAARSIKVHAMAEWHMPYCTADPSLIALVTNAQDAGMEKKTQAVPKMLVD